MGGKIVVHLSCHRLITHLTQFVGIFRVQHVAPLQIFVPRCVTSVNPQIQYPDRLR